jgi:hypothetical protein
MFVNKQHSVVIHSSRNLFYEHYRICTEYYSFIDDRIVSMYIYIIISLLLLYYRYR